MVDASATWDEEKRSLSLFVANRSTEGGSTVDVDLNGFPGLQVADAQVLAAPEGHDRHARNDTSDPERGRLRPLDGVTVDGTTASLRLPALSWAVVRLSA